MSAIRFNHILSAIQKRFYFEARSISGAKGQHKSACLIVEFLLL
ncbi:hypothetical protein BFV96_0959 [Alteromonas macleodii]|uniref:Uncharacterized protein n=1 Tax=Alteromonas macleodii TaxID=28108 RepID=A0AB36FYS0_ALTMA|nr:hypothetical protein BFV95_0959 [Alteromonas macleodii]OES41921.1 hypothetical protein BFV96_0959 [Alteromonas macleodii]